MRRYLLFRYNFTMIVTALIIVQLVCATASTVEPNGDIISLINKIVQRVESPRNLKMESRL